MTSYNKELQEHITNTALNNGALLVGYTKIRRTEPVIILGFPYSDKWFFKFPFTLTKKLGEVYMESKHVQNLIGKELRKEGYNAYNKTVFSVYGDFRPLAISSGLDQWGRNGLVVNKQYGSNLLFAAVFTDGDLDTSTENPVIESQGHCSDCGHCISSCPGKAFEDNRFHLNRCLPYSVTGCGECLKACKGIH